MSQGVRDQAGALSEGFQTAFLVGAGFALVGAVLAAVTISSRDCRKRIEAGRVEVPVPGAAQPQAQRVVAAG